MQMPAPERQLIRLRGSVTEQLLQRGTASEHSAVVLTTDQGEVHSLVRLGGNPFRDEATRRLIGQFVEAEGYLLGSAFRYKTVKVITSPGR